MPTVSSRIFSENPIHYLNLASREQVEVTRGKMVFQITQKPQFENISPSGDPYWADPKNVAELNHRLVEIHSGTEKSIPLDLKSLKIRMGL
jgi:hypothetical protein